MTTEMHIQLAQYIATEILQQPKKVVAPDAKLISSGMIDSSHLVDLQLYIEEKFGARIDDTELNKDSFDTIDQLVALIEARI